MTESAPLAPQDVYGATKAAGELLVAAYDRQYGLTGVSIRLSWVYGPRRATECVVRTMLCDALEKLAAARGAQEVTVEASDTASGFFEKRGYTATSRNTVLRAGQWLANTTMTKSLAAKGSAP